MGVKQQAHISIEQVFMVTDMPADFQKAIDLTLNNEKDTFAFLDDILIISHCTKEDHMNKQKNFFRQAGR